MGLRKKPAICFVGLENIPVLAPEFNQHGIGGEQVQQTLIAKALARRGYSVSMIVGDYGQKDGQVWEKVTTYKAYRFDAGLPVLRFFYPRLAKLLAALKHANADIYYTSCAGMQVGIVALFAKIYRRKMIYRIAHDKDCEPKELLINYWRDKRLYEYGLRHADSILAQSETQQKALLKNYQLKSQIATMLVDSAEKIKLHEERDIPVLWVNNIRQFKRPDIMLDLAKALPTIAFHMVGGPVGGFGQLYGSIEQQAREIKNLSFHGKVPYHDVNTFYARAKVFVNTSDTEGFPNSYLQAWIRGTPVIAFFDPDGIIAREGLGRSVKSLQEMQDAIIEYTTNPSTWNSASRRCLEYMQKNYNEDTILGPYIRVFDALAST